MGTSREIALRFTYSGTSTDFYIDEVPSMNIANKQYVIINRNIVNWYADYPASTHAEMYRKYEWGSAYRLFTVNFSINLITTRDKIKTLFDYVESYHGNPQIIQMYNEYKIDTDNGDTPSWIPVQMMRQDYRDTYFSGYDVPDSLPIRFVETTYSSVGVLERPVMAEG